MVLILGKETTLFKVFLKQYVWGDGIRIDLKNSLPHPDFV